MNTVTARTSAERGKFQHTVVLDIHIVRPSLPIVNLFLTIDMKLSNDALRAPAETDQATVISLAPRTR